MDEAEKRIQEAIEIIRNDPRGTFIEGDDDENQDEIVEADITLLGRKPLDKSTDNG